MVLATGLLTGIKDPVALKSIAVTLSIKDFVAGVSATLNYENEEKVPLEAFFVFPTDEDTAVYSFEALVDGKKIVAELQDKYEAHLKYEEDLSGGFYPYLLEEDKCSKDVFRCNVGNMQPGSKVTLTLKYVQELHLQDDGALCYVLPATLNPRYHLSDQSVDSCLDLKTPIVPLEDLPYTLSMVATISSQLGIRTIQCNCPLSSIDYTGENKTSAQVSLAEGHKFDQDVELLIFYRKVHSPCVTVEMGMPERESDTIMGAPCAMVSFYPDIPEVETSTKCGEFVFFMDCSGSMKKPLSRQNRSQLRIDAAKETLILLLKSLPLGCYFNIFGFGSTHEAFFPKSVRYTQESMERAVEKVKLMLADLGGTELLTPLRKVFRKPPIPGHPLQVFVFTDGEVAESFNVIKEVKFHSKRHRCFSFGIGEGVSTTLVKNLARVSGGTAEFITGSDRMQSKALRSLRRSLQSIVEDISLSWDLPPGLFVHMLSPEQTVVFRGQRIITYSLLAGQIPQDEATGEVCLKYTSHGKSYEEKVTFSLHPKPDDNLTSHHLAAKSMIQARDFGYKETTLIFKRDVLNISLESGIISSFTIFVAINKELNEPVYGPLYHRDIPRPILFSASYMRARGYGNGRRTLPPSANAPGGQPPRSAGTGNSTLTARVPDGTPQQPSYPQTTTKCVIHTDTRPELPNILKLHTYEQGSMEHTVAQLILLQNADGSWDMNEDLAKVLGTSLEDIKAAHPTEVLEPSSAWATVLAVIWLHANGKELKDEWELLERKAVVWLQNNAVRDFTKLMSTANKLLKTSVSSSIFTFKD
ncbi:von Willebrand factor A domain-containing protein 5A-like isoform X1 [Peromyscus leucopus]|uniref:von Willebrand factor A domain-containing protein 5A-like isoform X1 n=2 Tax=Peromyscus leucopus TaxID=10041 RepID=UPI0010A15049|nr:von Willebrand factor A domain-containing protein 5A-like isoform X1 [Peromyscus leucopus]XP_028722099.1 von Willebrand factor A domain-containing protein 5A-like isoform X1 [Peromyscus leucopus]XP_028722102.1 von Willebrand factor A domain-containing protein 5A-like isoform X1 [Peromyscus leucopus]XP_028722103.1 von Willebrand factor A domain-containing protein 5A-like isoform X1 [Peromyscus leucopus]